VASLVTIFSDEFDLIIVTIFVLSFTTGFTFDASGGRATY